MVVDVARPPGASLAGVIGAAIESLVERYCVEPEQRRATLELLRQPGFALQPGPCRAGSLTLAGYLAIAPELTRAAVLGAAAVELHMEAAYLFDEVADEPTLCVAPPASGVWGNGQGDPAPTCDGRVSASEKLAAAIGLMSCGAAAGMEAAFAAGLSSGALAALTGFHANSISACAGQYLDARFEKLAGVSTDDALRMTRLKSGSLGRFAAEFGASLGKASPEAVKLCGDFGFNLLTCAQLVDDVKDACPYDGGDGDLFQGKKTAPIAFFLGSMEPPQAISSVDAARWQLPEERAQMREQYQVSGASAFGMILAEVFLNRARSLLQEMKGRGLEVQALESIYDTVATASDELAFAG